MVAVSLVEVILVVGDFELGGGGPSFGETYQIDERFYFCVFLFKVQIYYVPQEHPT